MDVITKFLSALQSEASCETLIGGNEKIEKEDEEEEESRKIYGKHCLV